jgi:hypothetical protein
VHYHGGVGHAHHAITVVAVNNTITVAIVDHAITDASFKVLVTGRTTEPSGIAALPGTMP